MQISLLVTCIFESLVMMRFFERPWVISLSQSRHPYSLTFSLLWRRCDGQQWKNHIALDSCWRKEICYLNLKEIEMEKSDSNVGRFLPQNEECHGRWRSQGRWSAHPIAKTIRNSGHIWRERKHTKQKKRKHHGTAKNSKNTYLTKVMVNV